jgi:hypothetical protein
VPRPQVTPSTAEQVFSLESESLRDSYEAKDSVLQSELAIVRTLAKCAAFNEFARAKVRAFPRCSFAAAVNRLSLLQKHYLGYTQRPKALLPWIVLLRDAWLSGSRDLLADAAQAHDATRLVSD